MSVPQFAAEDFGSMLATFGESIVHRPLGVAAQDTDCTAIVILRGPNLSREGGRSTEHCGTIYIAPGPELSEEDLWIYQGETYAVKAIGKLVGGRIRIDLKRVEVTTRKNGFGTVM